MTDLDLSWLPGWALRPAFALLTVLVIATRYGASIRRWMTAGARLAVLETQMEVVLETNSALVQQVEVVLETNSALSQKVETLTAALTARTEEADAALAATRESFQRQLEVLTAELETLRPAAAEAAALRGQLAAVEAECFRLRQLACVTAPGCPKRLPVITTTEGDHR